MRSHSAKRTQLTLVLATVLVVLIGIIGWMEFGEQTDVSINNDPIDRITIKRAGHPDIELRLVADNWQLLAPYSVKANSQRIEPLLSLGRAKFNSYKTSEVDMTATGLSSPGAQLLIGNRTYALGLTDIEGDRRYALVDNSVTLLPEWVWSLAHGGVTAFADLSVFETLPNQLYLISDTEKRAVNNPDGWRTLQADKISAWPRYATSSGSQNDDNQSAELGRWQLSSNISGGQESALAEIVQYEDYALINNNAGFAYAISNERLNSLLEQ